VSRPVEDAWRALDRAAIRRSWGRLQVREGDGGRTKATLWTLVHVLWALGDLRRLGSTSPEGQPIVNYVDRYRRGGGYAARPRRWRRFFDDNAWLGLAALHVDRPDLATRALTFVQRGEDAAGGILWVEGDTMRNTCSTASAAWLALELGDRPFAARAMDWLDAELRTPEGLYMDNVHDGQREETVWSYNQGAPVAALAMLGRTDAATATSEASLAVFTGERLWREPPPFLAIWFRALLRDPAASGEATRLLIEHTDRLLEEALDPGTGLFTGGGIGTYNGSTTIDQAATVQLFALRELAAA
jgi:hypothetical protein